MTARIAFSESAEDALKNSDDTLTRAILNKAKLLKSDFHTGQPIAKRLIPKYYAAKYGITNLFRLELPGHRRLLYSLINRSGTVVCHIQTVSFLQILDHRHLKKRKTETTLGNRVDGR
jgi:hypothetical protein